MSTNPSWLLRMRAYRMGRGACPGRDVWDGPQAIDPAIGDRFDIEVITRWCQNLAAPSTFA